jgi:hypothetical protein
VVNHEALRSQMLDHLGRLLERTDELRTFLAFVQGGETGHWMSASLDARALAIVCGMAELESLVTTTIQCTHEALNDAGIKTQQLTPALRQMVAHSTFESLKEVRDHKRMWRSRGSVTTLDSCPEFSRFPVVKKGAPQPPLDGRTLKPEHFHRIWEIYQLPDQPFPVLAWQGHLVKMASARNDLAHGNLPYPEVFREAGRSVSSVEQYVGTIRGLSTHFADKWIQYLIEERYLIPEHRSTSLS